MPVKTAKKPVLKQFFLKLRLYKCAGIAKQSMFSNVFLRPDASNMAAKLSFQFSENSMVCVSFSGLPMATSCVQKANNNPYQEPPDVPRNSKESEYLERYEFLARLAADEALHASSFGPDPSSWPPLSNREGILAVVGSGIKAVCDFTTEAISLIKHADKVFYCVADPVTEVYIKGLSPEAQDLYVFYSNNKERYHTYVQMAEVMLHEVRKGLKVVTVYYGHPGVFVSS